MTRTPSISISSLVILFLLASSLPLAAGVPAAQGSIVFDGDDAFRGPLARALGVTGSGTASDPFVISGLSIPMPVYPSPTLVHFWPAIAISNTHAHVLIEGNIFYGVKVVNPTSETMGSRTAPAIVIVAAENVVVARNVFQGVGADSGTISVAYSDNIEIANNTFDSAIGPSISSEYSSVTIENNLIVFVGHGGAAVEVRSPSGGSRIARNVVDAWTDHLARALMVISIEGNAPVDIVDNRIRAEAGISIFANPDGPSLLVRGNSVEAEDCGVISAPARVEANSFKNCSQGLSVTWAAISPDNRVNGGMMLSVTNQTSLVIDHTHPPIGWLNVVDVPDVRFSDFHAQLPLVIASIENAANVEMSNVTLSTYTGLKIQSDSVRITDSAFFSNRSAIKISANATELHRVAAEGLLRAIVLEPNPEASVRITESRIVGPTALTASTFGCKNLDIANSTLQGYTSAILDTCKKVTVRNSSILGRFFGGSTNFSDARYNWWGHPSGPSGSGLSGQGSWVSRGVLVEPWLTSAP